MLQHLIVRSIWQACRISFSAFSMKVATSDPMPLRFGRMQRVNTGQDDLQFKHKTVEVRTSHLFECELQTHKSVPSCRLPALHCVHTVFDSENECLLHHKFESVSELSYCFSG